MPGAVKTPHSEILLFFCSVLSYTKLFTGQPMTESQTPRALSDSARRHCPVCGARVAADAETCHMCGSDLPPEAPQNGQAEATDASRQGASGGKDTVDRAASGAQPRIQKALRFVILGLITIIILAGSVILGMNLSKGTLVPEMLPTFTATSTHAPTVTPTPTQTPLPTETPPPTATATPIPPIEYTVQSGDTLLDIAVAFGVTVDELMGPPNNLESDIIVEGEILLIPPPTPTPGPAPTQDPNAPEATVAPYTLHTVRSGETLSEIALQYGVTVQSIIIASQLPEDTVTIQVNQVLTIPRITPTPTPETLASGGTETPQPGMMRYPSPKLLYPPDTAAFYGDDTMIALQWATVGILDEREYYRVELIIPTIEGNETVQDFVKSTVWRVPEDLFPPDTVQDRTFSWRVTVVRQVTEGSDPDRMISPAGRRRTFTWEIQK